MTYHRMNVARRTETKRLQKQASEPKLSTPQIFVRYLGFEAEQGERRLTFRVKSNGEPAVEVVFVIADATFTCISNISIQDAAPMAYEKLVELLKTGHELDTTTVCLTMADIMKYRQRHNSHGRPGSRGTRETGVAA